MIKQITFQNWKSYRETTLYIDPLTILIGTNASGKSNALDGLEFLRRASLGKEIRPSLAGDQAIEAIRGGTDWAAFHGENQFKISTLVEGNDNTTDFQHSITIETPLSSDGGAQAQLEAEDLVRIKYRGKNKASSSKVSLFWTEPSAPQEPSIQARLYNGKAGVKQSLHRSRSILSQLKGLPIRQEIQDGVDRVSDSLRNIFIFNPIPSRMRTFSQLSDEINTDASNIAGVLAALEKRDAANVEATLAEYITQLPERDIKRVWAEKVGRFASDAMLYCEEKWTENSPSTTIDSRSMSDGTLRFIAIVTALLTRPTGSLMVIEEIDNGLHPSRSHLLLRMLREIGAKRKIDILATTHNPALLDALTPDLVPFVTVAHRDNRTGESKLTLLEEVKDLPKLLASGPIGFLSTKGAIERSLANI